MADISLADDSGPEGTALYQTILFRLQPSDHKTDDSPIYKNQCSWLQGQGVWPVWQWWIYMYVAINACFDRWKYQP